MPPLDIHEKVGALENEIVGLRNWAMRFVGAHPDLLANHPLPLTRLDHAGILAAPIVNGHGDEAADDVADIDPADPAAHDIKISKLQRVVEAAQQDLIAAQYAKTAAAQKPADAKPTDVQQPEQSFVEHDEGGDPNSVAALADRNSQRHPAFTQTAAAGDQYAGDGRPQR